MRSLKMALIALLFIGFSGTSAGAQEHGVNGLLLGAGSGALVGQAIGRDTEGTLIGSAVGGMLGYMVGNEMDKDSYGRVYGPPQPVIYPSPPPPQPIYYPPPPPPRYYSSHPEREHFRHDYRPDTICRKTVVIRERHGRYRETLRTVCRDRDAWREDQYYHRGHSNHNRYGYNDRW